MTYAIMGRLTANASRGDGLQWRADVFQLHGRSLVIASPCPARDQPRPTLKGEIAVAPFQQYAEPGKELNPGSPQQLAHVLFDKLGLRSTSTTASGAPGTD